MEILDNIPLELKVEDVMESLKLGNKRPSMGNMVHEVLEKLMPIAKPKALYKESYIGKRGERQRENCFLFFRLPGKENREGREFFFAPTPTGRIALNFS